MAQIPPRFLPQYATTVDQPPPREASGYRGYQGYDTTSAPVQSVQEILTQPMGEIPPDLRGAQGGASRQRQIADMLMQGMQQQDNTSIAGGLSQLGQAFLARNAMKKADKAEASRDEIVSMLTQKAMQGDQASIAALLSPEAAIGRMDQQARQNVEDERYTDERDYGRGRDAVVDGRYIDERDYSRGRDQLGDQRYGQEYADERGDVAYERKRQVAANAPRDIWQPAGDGAIFNQSTGAYKQVSGGGNQGGQGGGGYTGTPAEDNFYIPTSADADNPFIQLQFGGMPTQGAEGGTLFDNGEIYTPGANGAQGGGGMPPNVDPNMYQRYRSSEYAKTDAEVAKDAREAAIKISTKTMPQIAQLKSLAGQFPSGFASDARYEAGRVAPFLRGNVGMSEAEMAARDTFVSQTKAFVLDLAQQMKGSLSDSDRAWVETMGARTNMMPESINQVLDTAERMAERQEFYAQGAEVWSNQYGGLSMTDQNGKNFYQAWSDWSSMNPITGGTYGGDAPTSGQSRRGGDDRKGGGTPKYERTATNPQTGEKIGLVNGQWVPIQ